MALWDISGILCILLLFNGVGENFHTFEPFYGFLYENNYKSKKEIKKLDRHDAIYM